ncbi:MAG: hypothetical protein M3Z01_07010 [Thermoproteota archaeon]|nr:hypothetical protein [Thermoproteota archaeon]
MKNLLFVFFLFCGKAFAQTITVKENAAADQTAVLQKAFDDSHINTVIVSNEVIINGTLTIPADKILKFEGGKLSGKGTINGGVIVANYQSHIFDTSLTLNPKAVNQYFSIKWFGANSNNSDNYTAIQKSINTCIKNNIRTVFLPVGRYKISKPLIILNSAGSFCTLEILGESSFWDANQGSEIFPAFSNTFAIGIQNGKGCKIRKLKITGLFTPPFTNDRKKFFNTSFENFKDGICRDSRFSPYSAIVIDPFTNLPTDKMPADGGYPGLNSYYGLYKNFSSSTGSTGTEIEEMSINNFVVGICSSPNGVTRNAEITLINKIQFENCKLCISGGQDQEKANVVSNIFCWGGTHTIFGTDLYGGPRMAGNWNIDHANIAGAVVRFIYNDQHGYFPTYISHVFAESLGVWGTINSELACEISDCHIDFEYQNVAGPQTLITSWGKNIVYRSCNFRYYGENTPMNIEGDCVFEHCYFSGQLVKKSAGIKTFFVFKMPSNKDLFIVILFFALAGIIFYLIKNKRLNFL